MSLPVFSNKRFCELLSGDFIYFGERYLLVIAYDAKTSFVTVLNSNRAFYKFFYYSHSWIDVVAGINKS